MKPNKGRDMKKSTETNPAQEKGHGEKNVPKKKGCGCGGKRKPR